MAVEAATPITAGARSILEGQAAGSKAVCIFDSHNLPRTWGDLSQTTNYLLLEGSKGDGAKAFVERVLAAYHKSSDATT
jgi:hypothetical protein